MLLFLSRVAAAAGDTDSLIREAGLKEGSVAVRDMPGWSTPRKILVSERWLVDNATDVNDGNEIIGFRSHEEAMQLAADADAIIGICDPELIAAAEKLIWVQSYSAGVDRCVSADKIRDGRVVLTNMQKMSSPTIGEHAIAMTLSLARGLTRYGKAMQQGDWNREFNMVSVEGRTMLVVGLGGIGREVARRAAALGMRVTATRNSSRDGPDYVDYVGLSDELLDLAAEADVIVNALPLTPATEGLFDHDFFAAVKPGVFFINVARGRSVVTRALVAALDDGRVAGAGLDVTDPEPLPPDHRLWQLDNVIITPHVAGTGRDGDRHMALLRENVRRFIAGEALLNVVDPQRGY